MRHDRVLLLVVAVGACARLDPIALDVCGNGVVEVGEDCDSATDPALGDGTACDPDRCRYTCDDGARCPAGWACAADRTCVYPSGEYVAFDVLVLAAEDIQLADLDGDRRADLIASAPEGLRVAWAAGGGFTPITDALTAAERTGASAIADLDGDTRPDLAIPVVDGLDVELTIPGRRLSPVAFSPFGPTNTALKIWHLPVHFPGPAQNEHYLILSGPHDAVGHVAATPEYFPRAASQPFIGLPDPTTWSGLPPRIPRFSRNGADLLVVAPTGGNRATLVEMSVWPFGGGDVFGRPSPLLCPGSCGGDAAAGDIDGDGDSEALVRDDLDRVIVFGAAGASFELEGTVDARFDALAQVTSNDLDPSNDPRRAWPLAVGEIDGDSRADAVSANGVFIATATGYEQHYGREYDDPWREAVIGDVDRDGDADVVAARSTSGVVVLLGESPNFTQLTYSTPGPVSLLRVADVDGDGAADVAMRLSRPSADDALLVLYSGEPRELVEVGRFPSIERIEAALLADTYGRFDGASDLSINSVDAGGNRVAILRGNGQRRLRSLLTLVRPGLQVDEPDHVVAGAFRRSPDGDAAELLVLAHTGGGQVAWWFAPQAGARLHPSLGSRLSVPTSWPSTACLRALAGDTDGDGRDELIAVDTGGCGMDARALVVAVPDVDGALDLRRERLLPTTGARDMFVAPLDDVPGVELIVIGDAGITWMALDGRDSSTTVAGLGAAALQADADPALELAVCDEGGLRILNLAGGTASEPTPTCAAGDILRAGDVDGDGLVDLARFEPAGVTTVFGARPHGDTP